MLSWTAASGEVLALNVVMLSPEVAVGVHSGGRVPMVQNSSTRLVFGVAPAARTGRGSRPSDRKGPRSRPAPTLPAKCLRVSVLRILVFVVVFVFIFMGRGGCRLERFLSDPEPGG